MIKTPVTEYFEGIGNRRFPLSLLINFVYLLCREKCMGNHIYYITKVSHPYKIGLLQI